MRVHQVLVEEDIQLTVPTGDQIEGADIVGESLQDFARYPSGAQSMPSRSAVLDSDIQFLDGSFRMIMGIRHGGPPVIR